MVKRPRGSGTIRKRGRALYLRYRTAGRLIEEVVPRRGGENMKEYRERAEEQLARKTVGLRGGTLNAPTRRTVEELAELYLDSSRQSVKPRTQETRENHVHLYVLPYIGHVRVDQLNPEDIRRFQQSLLSRRVRGGRTMAISTARAIFADFRDMVKYALDGSASREYWGVSFDPWPQRRLMWPDERERPAPHTYAPYNSREVGAVSHGDSRGSEVSHVRHRSSYAARRRI